MSQTAYVACEFLLGLHWQMLFADSLHGSHESGQTDRRWLEGGKVVVNDGQFRQKLGHVHHIVPCLGGAAGIGIEEEDEVLHKS